MELPYQNCYSTQTHEQENLEKTTKNSNSANNVELHFKVNAVFTPISFKKLITENERGAENTSKPFWPRTPGPMQKEGK